MNLLLDTHVVLWWLAADPTLKAPVRDAIASAATVHVSAASAWEVSIKVALRKLRIPGSFTEAIEASDFVELPVCFRHTARVAELPAHHADPFDRMLAAQALVDGLTLVTHDRAFEPYGAVILWA